MNSFKERLRLTFLSGSPVNPLSLHALIAFCFAHAIAIVAVSYIHYLLFIPSRLQWVLLELGLAVGVGIPIYRYLLPYIHTAYRTLPYVEKQIFFFILCLLGIAVPMWWANAFENNLWVYSRAVRSLFTVLLAGSRVISIALIVGMLQALTIQICKGNALQTHYLETNASPHSSTNRLHFVILLALFLFIANSFVVYYIGCERIIYFWDYMVYWTKTTDFGQQLRNETIGEVWDTFRHRAQEDDYGPIPALLPSFASVFFGESRIVYILSIVNLYLASVAVMAWLFCRRFAPSRNIYTILVPFATVLFSIIAWMPIVRGYLDIGGAALAIAALFTYLNRPAGYLRWTDLILISGLLALMTLFRRWYSFFVVAFFLVAMVDTGMAILKNLNRNDWRESLRNGLHRAGPIIMAGCWVALFISAFAALWVYRVLTTNYSDVYFAYQSLNSFGERIYVVIDNCGIANVATLFISIIYLSFSNQTRRVALFVGCMPPIMLLHMLKTADPGPHNLYLFLPAFVLLPSLALIRLLATIPTLARWCVLGLAVAWWMISMAVMFLPSAQPLYPILRPAISRLFYPPLVRNDLPEFIRLLQATEREAQADDSRIAVVASSLTINPTMFQTADQSLGHSLLSKERVLLTPEVDRVSGFPVGFFEANVLVVAWPPQTHLRPEEQSVVVLTAERIHNHVGIGKAFDRLPEEYLLEGGVTVSLYLRKRPVEQNDLDELALRLKEAHPKRSGLFTPPPGIEKWLNRP